MNSGKLAVTRPVPQIDWGEIHQRLSRAQELLQQAAKPTADQKNTLLKARAKALARESHEDAPQKSAIEVIEFTVAYEKYAIESRYVREVCPLKEVTPLPGTPAFVLGVIAIRGEILSVIDPKRLFDLPDRGLTDLNKVIIISDDNMEFGLLADAVLSFRQLSLDGIQPSLPTLTGRRAVFLKAITADRVVVLDGAKLLSDNSLIVNQSSEG